MPAIYLPDASYISKMPDGTVKQVNPLSGTQVWTVPGRGHRPLSAPAQDPHLLREHDHGSWCAFCEKRYAETPPEKARVVQVGNHWETHRETPADKLFNSVAEFRRVPNLFEILAFGYWEQNYKYAMPPHVARHERDYLSVPAGREHVLRMVRTRLTASGRTDAEVSMMDDDELLAIGRAFFASGHDVIIARRHYVDGATDSSQLASAGTLTPVEHRHYTEFTIDAIRELYDANRYVRYVAVFQNWLKPAGASFDHLHKQLVAIDDHGVQTELELSRVRERPNLYNEAAVNYAGYQNLVIAENDHAIAFAGFGHRYPSLEIYSKSAALEPWQMTDEERDDFSDLVHACHAATGSDVPCNEEWHHKPLDVDVPMPIRVVLKWRVSTMAGFEGGTKIYVNTLDPWMVRDRVVPRLYHLRASGRIASSLSIAMECECKPNTLRYNPTLRLG